MQLNDIRQDEILCTLEVNQADKFVNISVIALEFFFFPITLTFDVAGTEQITN